MENKMFKDLKKEIFRNVSKDIKKIIDERLEFEFRRMKDFFDKDEMRILPNLSVIFETADFDDAEKYAIGYFEERGYGEVGKSTIKSEVAWDNLRLVNGGDVITEHKAGKPDLVAFRGNNFIMIEVKTGGDGLRIEQLKWIYNHPTIRVIVFCLKKEKK